MLFTKIMFNNFFAGACAQIRILRNHFRLFGFYLFIFFALPISFLFLFFFCCSFWPSARLSRVKEFLRKRKRGKNYLPWTSKGWKGKFCSEFFTKISKHFGAYFKLHRSNHAGLSIVEKVLI